MHLTPEQIRTTSRTRSVAAESDGGGATDDLLAEVCRLLSLVPDVRRSKVEQARCRLLAAGPPSDELLAEVLLAELGPTAAR